MGFRKGNRVGTSHHLHFGLDLAGISSVDWARSSDEASLSRSFAMCRAGKDLSAVGQHAPGLERNHIAPELGTALLSYTGPYTVFGTMIHSI